MTKLICSSCGEVYKTRQWKPAMDEARCDCGGSRVSPSQYGRSVGSGAGRTSGHDGGVAPRPLRAGNPGAASSTPRRRKPRSQGFSASKEQQKTKSGRACIVCGRDAAETTIDAAHVTPRRLAPHCDCPKGVVPLCRTCHKSYDQLGGGFDLLPHLMNHGLLEETVHGFLQHGVSLREVMDTVTGLKWIPAEQERSAAA